MIGLIVRQLRWRILVLGLITVAFYLVEEGFHEHEAIDAGVIALGPVGISATLANLAGVGMILLFAGSVSADRREGYSQLLFAQPTSPLAYYALRWGICYALSMAAAVALFIFGQLLAWGEFRGGWSGLLLPLLSALIFGGLIAFFSTVLRGGEAWVVIVLLVPTFFPELLSLLTRPAAPWLRQLILVLLPPQTTAMQDIWQGLLFDSLKWGAVAFAAGYGIALLGATALIIRQREWA